MIMTKGRAIDEMLRWLDEATANGQAVPPDQIADLKDRAAYLLDGVAKYIARQFKIPAEYTVVRAPVQNLLGDEFVTDGIVPPNVYSATAEGAQSYYIEVSGLAAVRITSPGIDDIIIETAGTGGFEVYKGNLDGAGSIVTITVTSSYPFVVRNAAMYPAQWPTDEDVQDYTPYVAYELPDDFCEFDKLLQTSDSHNYRTFPGYKKEGLKTYLLPYDAEGQFEFRYFRNPADIPANAPPETEVEVQAHAAQLIGLKLAVDVCLGVDDTMTVGYYLENKFRETLMNLMVDDAGENNPVIETIYTM